MTFRFALLGLLLLLPSCKRSVEAAPSVSVPPPAGPPGVVCGRERILGQEGRSKEGRDCLWEHFQKGEAATFTSILQGYEGALTYTVSVRSRQLIELHVHSRDKMETPPDRSSAYTCTNILRVEKPGAAPGLVLTGCGSPDEMPLR